MSIKIDLFGNTVWQQTLGFQTHAKLDHSWHLIGWKSQVWGLKSKIIYSLKITEKVTFNIASKATYVYILGGQKWMKKAKTVMGHANMITFHFPIETRILRTENTLCSNLNFCSKINFDEILPTLNLMKFFLLWIFALKSRWFKTLLFWTKNWIL